MKSSCRKKFTTALTDYAPTAFRQIRRLLVTKILHSLKNECFLGEVLYLHCSSKDVLEISIRPPFPFLGFTSELCRWIFYIFGNFKGVNILRKSLRNYSLKLLFLLSWFWNIYERDFCLHHRVYWTLTREILCMKHPCSPNMLSIFCYYTEHKSLCLSTMPLLLKNFKDLL